MNADLIARLRAQLGGPRDGALLRFSLGTALLSNGDACGAIAAFREAGVTTLNVVQIAATPAERVKLIEQLRNLV